MGRRTEPHTPGRLDAAQQELYEEIALGSRATESAFPLTDEFGVLAGPFDAMLLEPGIGRALQALGAALRFHGRLTDRAREIAILLVGHRLDSDFEVYAHEAVGRRIGLDVDDLAALAKGVAPPSADHYERTVVQLVTQLMDQHDLADEDYDVGVSVLGEEGVFEVNALVGYYTLLATQLRIFRVPSPD